MKKVYDLTLRGHHLRLLYGFNFAQREEGIRSVAIQNHGHKHATNLIKTLKKITENPCFKVKIVDTLDEICKSCDEKGSQRCKKFIKYDISAAADDRGTAYYYGLKINQVYTARHILKKLKTIGYQL